MDPKTLIKQHIREKLASLEELGKVYSEEKIDALAENLSKTGKTLTEINTLVDNKFSHQLRKINQDNYLASLKEYYLDSISKLKGNNNCYILSYDQGVKILEQAEIKDVKQLNPSLKLVSINGDQAGYRKENSINNDYELIISDIAYLLNIEYAKTYRIFDEKMDPKGIVNTSFAGKNERFLNLEEVLRFVKEESSKFNLKQELLTYHDRHIKHGLKEATSEEDYNENLEYIFKLFKALPDITDKNVEELKKSYLNMKVFELLTNSLNNDLSNTGLIVNKESLHKYTYRLSPSYNKYTTKMDKLSPEQTICNFYIVEKAKLLSLLVSKYYAYIKETLSLIADNEDTLIPLINQVIKEHLEYDEYENYHTTIESNIALIKRITLAKKENTPDDADDKARNEDNNILYKNRIAPFVDNYVSDEYEDHGSTLITAIVTAVLLTTVGIILLAIYAVSKLNM